jgi:hypothetical protein
MTPRGAGRSVPAPPWGRPECASARQRGGTPDLPMDGRLMAAGTLLERVKIGPIWHCQAASHAIEGVGSGTTDLSLPVPGAGTWQTCSARREGRRNALKRTACYCAHSSTTTDCDGGDCCAGLGFEVRGRGTCNSSYG